MRPHGFDSLDMVWMASDFDGAFAQYVKAPASEVFAVDSGPERRRARCAPVRLRDRGEHAPARRRHLRPARPRHRRLGRSGRRRGAARQAARRPRHRRRLARARTRSGPSAPTTSSTGDAGLTETLGEQSVDVVVDNVAGTCVRRTRSHLLRRGGRYVTSGAVAGPGSSASTSAPCICATSRSSGCTAWDEQVFPDLVSYQLERGELRPPVAAT